MANIFSQITNVLSGIHQYTLKYNVCSTNLEQRCCICIYFGSRIYLIVFFNKYAVPNFWLLNVNVLHKGYPCFVSSVHSLTSLTAYCIHAIVN